MEPFDPTLYPIWNNLGVRVKATDVLIDYAVAYDRVVDMFKYFFSCEVRGSPKTTLFRLDSIATKAFVQVCAESIQMISDTWKKNKKKPGRFLEFLRDEAYAKIPLDHCVIIDTASRIAGYRALDNLIFLRVITPRMFSQDPGVARGIQTKVNDESQGEVKDAMYRKISNRVRTLEEIGTLDGKPLRPFAWMKKNKADSCSALIKFCEYLINKSPVKFVVDAKEAEDAQRVLLNLLLECKKDMEYHGCTIPTSSTLCGIHRKKLLLMVGPSSSIRCRSTSM